jgi:hypothetical protein
MLVSGGVRWLMRLAGRLDLWLSLNLSPDWWNATPHPLVFWRHSYPVKTLTRLFASIIAKSDKDLMGCGTHGQRLHPPLFVNATY